MKRVEKYNLLNDTYHPLGNLGEVILLVVILLTFLAGCSQIPVTPTTECDRFTNSLTRTIERFGHYDPATPPISSNPYQRFDRFLASYASQPISESEREQWLAEMYGLGIQKFQEELERIPHSYKEAIIANTSFENIRQALNICAGKYRKSNPLTPSQIEVKPSYSGLQRLLGLYPVSRYFAASGIREYQREMTERIRADLYKESTAGIKSPQSVRTYWSGPKNTAGTKITLSIDNPLGIPRAPKSDITRLFQAFAPIIRVQQNSADDHIGKMHFDPENRLAISSSQPRLYTYTSHTRFEGQVLLQLNYVFWFPRRSGKDLYSGELDGLVWRVTLDRKGQPLLFDSIHHCGCYHVVFLTARVTDQRIPSKTEKPLIFSLPETDRGNSWILNIEAGTHYLTGVKTNTENTGSENWKLYDLFDYSSLLILPSESGSRSAFSNNGIIDQSSRGERWLLWPLGIPNAGAMRQAGLQATAFIGIRHFDDPFLFEDIGLKTSTRLTIDEEISQ